MKKRSILQGSTLTLIVTFLIASGVIAANDHEKEIGKVWVEQQPVFCADEFVHLRGYVLEIYFSTTDSHGLYHIMNHLNYMGVTGIGKDSGNNYRGAGATHETINRTIDTAEDQQSTRRINFMLIAQGAGPNYMIHATKHTTINANGDITSEFNNFSCTVR